MEIKTTLISAPTKRAIALRCPFCQTILYRSVARKTKEGKETCGVCRAKFKWQGVGND